MDRRATRKKGTKYGSAVVGFGHLLTLGAINGFRGAVSSQGCSGAPAQLSLSVKLYGSVSVTRFSSLQKWGAASPSS